MICSSFDSYRRCTEVECRRKLRAEMNEQKLKQMQTVLLNALSPDNMVRGQAEKAIEQQLLNNREMCVLGLSNLLRSAHELQIRALCAIILRRRLPTGEPTLFDKLSQGLQDTVKTDLLASIADEPERYVSSTHICFIASQVANHQPSSDQSSTHLVVKMQPPSINSPYLQLHSYCSPTRYKHTHGTDQDEPYNARVRAT